MNKVLLPEDWHVSPLDKVAAVQTGIAKGKTVNGSGVTLPYLRVANVQDGHVDLSVIKKITVEQSDVLRYSLRDGDVLFTEGGDFDKLGRGTVWHSEISPCLHQNHIFAVRPAAAVLLPEFLAFQAASRYGRRYFQESSKQSTNLASINSTQLKNFPVLVAPIEEQQKIVAVLQAWDDAIDKLDALYEAKSNRLDGVAQRLFAPAQRAGKAQKRGWRQRSFGAVFTERLDRNCGLDSDAVVTVGKYAIRKQSEHFTRSVASSDLSKYWTISPGDFVYDPMSAYYGALGQYAGDSNGIVSPAYRVIRLSDEVLPVFMVYLLKTHRIRFLLETRSSQGNKEGKRRLLQRDEFASIDFSLPPIEEQVHIAEVLSAFDKDLVSTAELIETVKRQRRGLMQKLLTGEWRVNGFVNKEND